MFKAKMIENDFRCQNQHDQQIHLVVLDPKLDKKQRLLCTKCMENFESDAKTIGYKKVIQIIEDTIENNFNKLENITQQTVQQLQICIKSIEELKTQFMKLFDSLIRISEDWSQNLLDQRQQYNQYSFYDELETLILKENANYISNLASFNNINRSWIIKLCNNLNQYIQEKDKVIFREIKQKFINISYSNQSIDCQLKPNQQKIIEESQIKLKLIDQSVKQSDRCRAIVFDSSGSIMVSTQEKDIKIWRFQDGKTELITKLQGHTNQVQCLIFSKCLGKAIICWRQQNSSDWRSSLPYQQHTDYVRCIILNLNEDLLFSRSADKSIKVWKVDFDQNILKYLYSLDKHNNEVGALSLNQSETQLASCAKDKNQIIIWERREQDKFEFKYFVIIDEIYNSESIQQNNIFN